MSASRPIPRTPLLATVLVLLAAACGGGGGGGGGGGTAAPSPRPSSTATIEILSPANGAKVAGGTVEVKVRLTGARIVPATTTDLAPDRGHLHIYLDNEIVSMNFATTGTIPNVAPGTHVLRVEFVASDHGPFNPRDFVESTFEVTG